MDTNSATLQMPRDLIEAAVRQNVSAAVIAAFKEHPQIIEKLVLHVLNQQVTSSGKVSSISYANRFNLIDVLAGNAIREMVRETLSVEVQKYKDHVRENIIAALRRKNSPLLKQLAESMASGIVSASTSKWRMTVEFKDD